MLRYTYTVYLVCLITTNVFMEETNYCNRGRKNYGGLCSAQICLTLHPLKGTKSEMAPDFRNSNTIWKVPRLRPFVFLVREICIWIWVYCTGGMILTRWHRITRTETWFSGFCPPYISHGLICDRNRAFGVTSRRLTAYAKHDNFKDEN